MLDIFKYFISSFVETSEGDSLNFLARSCKILQLLGFLCKKFGKILIKKSKNIQDSFQEFKDF